MSSWRFGTGTMENPIRDLERARSQVLLRRTERNLQLVISVKLSGSFFRCPLVCNCVNNWSTSLLMQPSLADNGDEGAVLDVEGGSQNSSSYRTLV